MEGEWQGFDIVPLRDMGLETNASVTGLALAPGQVVYACVIVENWAGLLSNVSSDGMLLDATPPVITAVNDGFYPAPDVDQQSYVDTLFANWVVNDPYVWHS